jgi:hypothetical protein
MKVERTTRAGVAAMLGVAGNAGAEPRKEIVVVTLQAVDRFHALVGNLFKDGGRLDEALDVCQRRLGRDIRECGADSREVGRCFGSLGIVYGQQGDYPKALEH